MHEEEAFFRGADHVRLGPGIDGETIAEICRRLGVSQQTFYRWKKKFGAMGLTEIRRLKRLVGHVQAAYEISGGERARRCAVVERVFDMNQYAIHRTR